VGENKEYWYKEYLMEKRTTRIVLSVVIVIVLLIGTFSSGLIVGWMFPRPAAAQAELPVQNTLNPTDERTELAQNSQTPTPESTDELFKPFWQAWQLLHDQYVDQPVDDLTLMRGAINGMMNSLGDAHTSYMDPSEYQSEMSSLAGEYDGIGAWVDITGEYLKIISPIPGSPAEAVGLIAGDTVIAVNGQDMTGKDGQLVLDNILGPAGTSVTLTILRENETIAFDVTITRAHISIPSVQSEMLDGNIAYIQLAEFGEHTSDELKQALTEVMANNPNGLILDLRNNGGGYLTTAIGVASEFFDSGKVIMYEQFSDGSRQTYTSLGGGLAVDIPMVVLVNGGTASASEILAGAIQDYQRGLLVGTITYGKGSVQNWIALQDEQGAVRITIARWLTPLERQINNIGLTPDVVVEITQEDIQNSHDVQLDKALELLGVSPIPTP
jgi:carboxyl-terminal processing protease